MTGFTDERERRVLRLFRFGMVPWLMAGRRDRRGRVRVWLGRKHPYAQKGGQQWRYRYVAMMFLGRRLQPDEHVHHLDGNVSNDHPSNLAVVAAEYHGSYHCWFTDLTEIQDQFLLTALAMPDYTYRGARRGPILSRRALPQYERRR